ncbi:MAG TPA: FeoA domain-containing protein [Candidatus Eisenbergiella merdipullorum]|uniref:FeoA domain-containing protein n=1 Tax=Candidatus Eisenbergiella merdipullorum TaxID=2838553 RepID=A0A9D2I5G0_9FIRM|nr:FeoA domain-containing protein [Candidatus Eisenbergiella merdipullorum]
MPELITLAGLTPGTSAVIRRMDIKGAPRRRLMTAGLIENTEIRCVGKSPLGNPLAYRVRGTTIALRRKEAEAILVEKRDGPLCEPLLILAGNPNVGKSTVFNALTGLHRHTGNWAGKTVECAQGTCRVGNLRYRIADIPGCYSLLSGSAEENEARNFLLSHTPDAVIAVCDAARLESTLPLSLQLLEMDLPVILCVNLMDEAAKKNRRPDLHLLSERLSVPAAGTAASRRGGLHELEKMLEAHLLSGHSTGAPAFRIHYPEYVETAISLLTPAVQKARRENGLPTLPSDRWLCLCLLEKAAADEGGRAVEEPADPQRQELKKADTFQESILLSDSGVRQALSSCQALFASRRIDREKLWEDRNASCLREAEKLCEGLYPHDAGSSPAAHRLDQLLTGKRTAFPVMLLFLLFLFWLTIRGANYPSALLSSAFSRMEGLLEGALLSCGVPPAVADLLAGGVFGTTGRVISVMLPPMAIFFPLFTLLEDMGFLPRIAFDLDRCFQGCGACGKQAITMCIDFEYL